MTMAREAALAAADGALLPSHWFSQSMEMAKDLHERMQSMRDVLPDGWEQTLDDFMFALGEENEGFDPRETSG